MTPFLLSRYVDLYAMSPRLRRNDRLMYEIQGRTFDHADLFPLQELLYNGVAIPFPARPERILGKLYGAWWRVRETRHGSVS